MKTILPNRFKTLLFLIFSISISVDAQLPDRVLVGYWHNWESTRLKDIDDRYNVLMLSFLEADKNNYQDDNVITDLEFTPYSSTQLKADIPVVQSEGKKVIVSIGGANGSFKLNNLTDKNTFVTKVKDFIIEYGVDGIDIDLERTVYMCSYGGTMSSPEAWTQYLIDGVEELLTWYQTTYSKKMILTAAPEVSYTTGALSPWGSCKGSFLPFIEQLRDDLDLLMIQLYNSGSNYSIGYPSNSTAYNQGTADFIITQTEAAIEGFTSNSSAINGTYSGLPASKVAVALPSSTCAGGGYVSTSDFKAAMSYLMGCGSQPGSYTLSNTYPSLRGMMTWSANEDASTCGGVYSFAQAFSEISCLTVGNEEIKEIKFNFFPNPSGNSITINTPENLNQIKIQSINGQTLIETTSSLPSSIIDVSTLPNGIYLINVNNSIKRFIKK